MGMLHAQTDAGFQVRLERGVYAGGKRHETRAQRDTIARIVAGSSSQDYSLIYTRSRPFLRDTVYTRDWRKTGTRTRVGRGITFIRRGSS